MLPMGAVGAVLERNLRSEWPLGILIGLMVGAFASVLMTFMSVKLAAVAIVGLLVLIPTFLVADINRYWLAMFLFLLPLNIKKSAMADPKVLTDLIDRYGTPPGASPAPTFFLADAVLAVLFLFWLIRAARSGKLLVLNVVAFVGFLYLCWSGMTALNAPVKQLAILEMVNRTKYFLIFLYFCANIRSRRELHFLVALLVAGMCIQGALSSYQFYRQSLANPLGFLVGGTEGSLDIERLETHFLVKGPGGGDLYRVGATVGYDNPNQQAQYYLLVLPFAMALAMASKEWWVKILWWCAFLLGLAGLVMTFSRGGLLGLGVASATMICLGVFRRLIPVAYLTVFLAGPILSAPLVYKYMSTRPEYVGARFSLWRVGWPILSDYAILGVGVNNAVVVSLTYPDPEGAFWKTSFHNFYLTTGIEIGLVGLGLFLVTLAMAGWVAFSAFRPPKDSETETQLMGWLSITVPAVLLGLCAHLAVDHLNGEINATITWMICAIGPILAQLARTETGLERHNGSIAVAST